MRHTETVHLGDRSYDIVIGPGLLAELGELTRANAVGKRVLLVSDETVAGLYGTAAGRALESAGYSVTHATVPPGEASKSGEQLFHLFDRAVAAGLDRHAIVVALGGGVVGDLAGFMAATYLRGIRLVQVPTTLLAMVDSAVGGKTGINLPQGKNLVGSFHQPVLVLCDTDALTSLPRREFDSGLAEVIKHGVIWDADLFAFLEQQMDAIRTGDAAARAHIVARSCAIKAAVVAQDERESGLRAILNFGHTLGHAVENVAGYGAYLHGEAIGIGMAFAARVSERVAGLPVAEGQRLLALVQRAGLPVAAPDLAWRDLRRAMEVDKKGTDGRPRFVLAERIGKVAFGCEVAESVLEEVWRGGR
jgi:3-dehydroquinate synthase